MVKEIEKLSDEELIYLSFLIEKEIIKRIQGNGGEVEEKDNEKDN